MAVKLKFLGDTIQVTINNSRIEGQNFIFQALVEDSNLPKNIENLIFDMDKVEYVNSLGIAEFISIHRYFASVTNSKTRIRFINVNQKIANLFRLIELGNLSEIELKTPVKGA